MPLFTDRFIAAFVAHAEQALAEPDARARARQMVALAANILPRLSASELLEGDTKKSAALLAMDLIAGLNLEVYGLAAPPDPYAGC
jgi:hypothetical protein